MNQIKFTADRFLLSFFVLTLCLATATFAQDNAPPPKLPAGMTGSNVNDPRVNLSPGLYDAGEAAFGMRHLNLLKKPQAFQLGDDKEKLKEALKAFGIPENVKLPPEILFGLAPLAFGNSDLAFQGENLFLGNFYGVNIYDISNPEQAKLLTSMICPGGQGDVSVYGNLMFMSVEATNGRLDCGTQAFPITGAPGSTPAAEKERFRGVRIFDISDIQSPKQVGAVQTCRGSHTHTFVEAPKDKENVYVYVSGTSFVRPDEELAGCKDGNPNTDSEISRFSIDVIKVPIKSPQDAKIVASPRLFGDSNSGKINALTDGGSHDNQGKPADTDQCHDITVYEKLGLAAGACSGNGILMNIKDPANPIRIDQVNDKNFAYWHSATFSNDGKKVVFTDEWGGGLGARCRANDPNIWGANALFNLDNDKLEFVSYYKLPAAQTDTENCVAHNGSLVPVPGRDIKVQSWYQGGISIMDFTDAKKPMEIAYFDRGPIDRENLMMGGTWSAYWYNGNIYSSEIARGLDSFELIPTENLTQNEIDAAKTVKVDVLNVQNQQMYEHSRKLVVAKAYLDQLERSKSLTRDQVFEMRQAILQAEITNLNRRDKRALKKFAKSLKKEVKKATTATDISRMNGLAAILNKPTL